MSLAQQGEELFITSGGRVVARLTGVPTAKASPGRQALLANLARLRESTATSKTSPTTEEILDMDTACVLNNYRIKCANPTQWLAMTLEKSAKLAERVNVSLLESVQEIAAKVMQARLKGDNFSELVRDLIIEEYKRPETLAKAELEWLRQAFRDALTEIAKLKEENAKAKEEALKWKDQHRGLKSAIKRHYAEEAAKKAGPPAT